LNYVFIFVKDKHTANTLTQALREKNIRIWVYIKTTRLLRRQENKNKGKREEKQSEKKRRRTKERYISTIV
jgi:hypothetical protein